MKTTQIKILKHEKTIRKTVSMYNLPDPQSG